MNEKQKNGISREKVLKILYFAVLFSFIIPIIYLSVRLSQAKSVEYVFREKSDYVLMIAECLLGVVVINIPSILSKKLRFDFPVMLNIMYLVFLYCAIVLGEVHSFYYIVPHWDTVLHCFSSMMLGIFGYMFVYLINRDTRSTMKLSPLFVAIFAFCFAVTIGVIWEFYEYLFDGLWGMNMQKFRLKDGTVLQGRYALSDTMEDLIIDAFGALIATIIGFVGMKKNRFDTKPSSSEPTLKENQETPVN